MLLVRITDQMSSPPEIGPRLPHRITLASQTVQSLRDAIVAGHWQGYLPGERELCARLRVSRQTLRTALEELQREGWLEVADRKRRRIKPNRAPQGAAPHSKVIAGLSIKPLLAMSASSIVMVDELRDHLTRAGFSLQLHVSPACFSAHPARALDALTARSPAAAWILFGSLEPMQAWFIRHQVPCLVAGSCAPGVALPSIDIDYRAACRHAGGLLRRNGHRRVAFIRTDAAYGGDADSEEGLRESMSGDPAASLQVVRHNGTAAHLMALFDKALKSAQPPTACVVARCAHALTVVTHLLRQGKRIPEDLAVISRDDDAYLEHVTPDVTRYSVNQLQFARRVSAAARELAESGTLPPRAMRLMPKLVRGETV
jgi:DNA-binding LacI/PurR family transcriptional regulator